MDLKYLATYDTIFDTLFLPENLGSQSNIHAFCIPLGQYAGRRVKDIADTNMMMCGMLPSPDTFDVHGLAVQITDDKGMVPTSDPCWDGVLTFQVNANQILGSALRSFDDAFLFERIKEHNVPIRRRDNGKIVFNRALIPLEKARAEAKIAEIHQCEYFGCKVAFTKRPETPIQMTIGISGIRYFAEF